MKLPTLKPEDVVVTCDNREPPEDMTWLCSPLTVVRGTLQTGDFALRDFPDVIRLERKSERDFLKCVGVDRERFEREIERLRAFPIRVVIAESTWQRLEAGGWRSRVTPKSAVGSALGWIASGISFVMAEDREKASEFAAKLLFITARREWRKARSFVNGVMEEKADAA